MKRTILAISTVLLSLSSADVSAAVPSTSFDLYSETTYLSAQDNFVDQSKLTYRLFQKDQLLFYIGAAIDQDSASDEKIIYNDNHAALLGGARFTFPTLPVSLFAELREAFRFNQRPASRSSAQTYFKGGMFGYQWFDLSTARERVPGPGLKIEKKTAFFEELYGEAVYTSKIESGLAGSAWSKTGVRAPFATYFNADLYGEIVIKRSTLDYLAENLQEIGPAARVSARVGSFSAALSLRRGFGSYAASPQGTFAQWTGLLVLAGEL